MQFFVTADEWERTVAPYEDAIKREDAIAIIWTIDDVKSLNDKLTDDEARVILGNIRDNFDAGIGINWDVIQVEVDNYLDLYNADFSGGK
jgi:hypothetical protein